MTIDSSKVTVYWRPGCPYCRWLRWGLRRHGVDFGEVNIWEVPEGAALVRSLAGGNETVPTVLIGDVSMVNPSAREVVAEIRTRDPGSAPRASGTLGRRHLPWRKGAA